MEFEWDEFKEQENLRKHGISFARSIETFRDPQGVKLVDVRHSGLEQRLFWVGKDSRGEILTIRYTVRGSRVRIIGCGLWRRFRRYYLEASKER